MVSEQYLKILKNQIAAGEAPQLPLALYPTLLYRRSSDEGYGVLVSLGLLTGDGEISKLGTFYIDFAGKLFYT